MPDGRFIAWVFGTQRYATLVGMNESGELEYRCTCPYTWGPCKHAVAVILVYLDAIREKQEVPEIDAADERTQLLLERASVAAPKDWEMDEDFDSLGGDSYGEAHEHDQGAMGAPRGAFSGRAAKATWVPPLQEYLSGLSRQALTDLMLEFAADHPDLREALDDRAQLQRGCVEETVASIRREIDTVSSEPGWTRHWSNEGHIPDYSRVRQRIEALLEAGHADAVVSLGQDLLRLGFSQIELSDDEGETSFQVGHCMHVVFDALIRSSLPPADQLLWAIDAYLADDHGTLDATHNFIEDWTATKRDWSMVADTLRNRLDEMSTSVEDDEDDSFSRRYHRQGLMRWLIVALERAGRKGEVIPLLEREAPITGCYLALVERLIRARRREDAARWAKEGFERTVQKWPGIAWALLEKLTHMAELHKEWHKAAAWRALAFFHQPGVSCYATLEKMSKKAGYWADVRAAVLHYLETGQRPDLQPERKSASPRRKDQTKAKSRERATGSCSRALPWPLPPTGLAAPGEQARWRTFPDTGVLIDIAIREKRMDDVVQWHKAARKRAGVWGGHYDDKVAEAVQKTHPGFALELWKKLAEAEIALVKPAAYQVAGRYLRKMRAVYRREKRLREWDTYLTELREENKRRPRMLEVLDSLEGKRIIDG